MARYVGDKYYRLDDNIPGNPWFVTTLWTIQYKISIAKNEKDLKEIDYLLSWISGYKNFSGMLSEQVNPFNGEQISVSPLIWSHAEFVSTVIEYMDRGKELGIWEVCNPSR